MTQAQTAPGPSTVTKRRALFGSAWVAVDLGSDKGLRVVRSLLLTHLISQRMFGILGLGMIVVGLVSAFSDFGGNMAIMRKRRQNEQRFLDTAWTLSVLRGFTVWLVICALTYPAARFYGEPALMTVIPLLGVASIFTSAYSTKITTMNRDLLLGKTTVMKIATRVLGLIATVSWALVAPENLGVIIIGPVFSVALMMVASFVMLPGQNNRFAYDRDAAREVITFGRWIFLSTLLTFFLRKGDFLVVGKLISTEDFAVYNIAYVVANTLPDIFQALNGRVIFPIFAEINHAPLKHVRRKVFKARRHLLWVAIPAMWVMVLFGRQIVYLLYPASYADAGWMLELYAAGMIGNLIGLSSGGILLARGDSFMYMIIRVLRGSSMLVGMWIGWMIGNGTGLYDLGRLVAVVQSHFQHDPTVLTSWLLAHPVVPVSDPKGALTGLILGMGASYWLSYIPQARELVKHGMWQPRLDLVLFALSAAILAARLFLF